jgi:ATP/maltotriose-dependent transcriptional regulator MalT/DNA-binding SARP family transcriptional activator
MAGTTIGVTQTRIERPELAERLVEGLVRGSVVLVADAGFGKTTALEQALRRSKGLALWLRATPADRDPGRLIFRVVEAVRAEIPGVADEHAERLAAAAEPIDPEAVARALAIDLERLLVERLVIAIDDAERLDGSGALPILDALLEGSHDVVRLGLCSRRSLGLKLARLKASSRVSEFGPADLAFSPAECAACLRQARGREASSGEVEALYAATEGWPLGVALAAAAGPGAEPPAQGREAVFEYLAEEVYEGLDPALQQRMLDASVVDELDPDLEAALGLPESFRTEIAAAGALVRQLGDSYGFHPLLREFLRTRLVAERDHAELRKLHLRLAQALASSGRTLEAIDHWLAAEDFDAAAEAIAWNGIALTGTAPESVAGWLGELPPESRDRPMLRLLAGRLAMGEGDFDAAIEHCRAGVSGLEREHAPDALIWSARLALTDAHIAAIDLEAAAAASAGADQATDEAGPAAVFCALAHAAVLARLGAADSDRALDRALERPTGRELLGPGLSAFQAHYRELPAGHLDDALVHVDEGIAALEAGDAFNRLPYVLVFKMAIHEARGELDRALETFDATLAAAQRSGLAGYVGAGARLAAATMLALLDRPDEARVQLDRVDRDWSSWAGCDKHVARAVLAWRDGDAPTAVAQSGKAIEESRRMPAFDRVRPTTVLAPVLCDAGEASVARAALVDVLEALGPGESKARTRAALASVLHRSGEDAAAHDALVAAFEQAGAGARYVLRCEWPFVEGVLWSALEAGALDAESTVGALDAAFPGGAQVMALVEHPKPAVREAAVAAAAAAGRPEALARLAEGETGDGAAKGSSIAGLRERLKRQPPPLRFRTLGRFEVWRGSYALDGTLWERKVAERVVRLLLVRGGELVPEDELLEAFWPEKPPGSARRGLQTAISSARAVLDLPWERTRLRARERSYALTPNEDDRLDADAFETAARKALATSGPERIAALEAATRMWTGEPLPEERYSDWATGWRERLISVHADVLGGLVEAHSLAGDHAAAARAARALVDLDPLDERAQRLLMSAYASAGRRGAALRQFLECRRALVEQLGIEPDAETLALQRRILAGT